MNRSSKGRCTRSEAFTSNLNAYALAAAATGVSMLALIQPAESEIVFTPTNKVLPGNFYSQIDLNHDGTPDFKFNQYTFQYHSWFNDLEIWPHASNGVIESSKGFAAVLPKGAPIGAGQIFKRRTRIALLNTRGFQYGSTSTSKRAHRNAYSRHISGPWQNAQDQYLGVTFTIDGATHYGWMRLSISLGFRRFTTTLNGFAYETIPGKTIYAGQLSDQAEVTPAAAPIAKPALGVLALGYQGLDLWRREDSVL